MIKYAINLQEQLTHITDTESLKKLEQILKPLELQDCLNAFVKRLVFDALAKNKGFESV